MTLPDLCSRTTEDEPYYDILARLLEHAVDGDVVEVGLGAGYTHLVLHRVAGERRVIGIDNLGNQELFGVNPTAIAEHIYGMERQPYLLLMNSAEAAAFLEGFPIALLFLDGDHRYDAAREDMERFFPLVVPGGTIAVHDSEQLGVRRAIEETKPLVSEEFTWPAPDGGADSYPRTMWTAITKAE